jgi:hypothetical protein
MRVPHLRVLAGTGVMAATVAMAIGLASTTANAAQGPAGGSTAAAAAAKKAASDVTSNVTGTFKNSDGAGTFAGTFTPKKFSVVNGTLEATGPLTGTLTNADGSTVGTVDETATMPVNTAAAAADPASCGILNLVLGPLNLNLLGLVVTLNQVHLNITAVPGVGNLLGNLLCDVANLLNGGGSLSEISTLLNEILALL